MDPAIAMWLADIARGLMAPAFFAAVIGLIGGAVSFVMLNDRSNSEHQRAAALVACRVLFTVGILGLALTVFMPSPQTILVAGGVVQP